VFNIGQVTAVRGAFALAGYDGPLRTLAVDDPTERIFVLGQDDALRLDLVTLEQIVGQVLGIKVWIVSSIEDATVPFG